MANVTVSTKDQHPKFGKRVLADDVLIGFILPVGSTTQIRGSVGNVSIGTRQRKGFKTFTAEGNLISSFVTNRADAIYDVTRAAQI